ncbi:MAG: fumarylacetoacetate hydrolase family protein [Acidobacteriota bacterium]|nr:MAG: fumarylacetoacetate hydrolase family protein [Acidobacteriota bacterium]
MKICRVRYGTVVRYGELRDGSVALFPAHWQIGDPIDPAHMTDDVPVEDAEFLVPVEPSKIVCVGRNYAKHAEELNNPLPEEPLLFLKAPSALITEGEPIRIPAQSEQVEHEGELAFVIGRMCWSVGPNENPLSYVFGYLPANDVTARDLQRKDVQFTRAKSFDSFCPVGRTIQTDASVSDVRVTTTVNGELRQEGRTSEMIFDIGYLIRYISEQMTLNAGDLVLTGTPAGVSRILEGDVCVVDIEGIGRLSNPVTTIETSF